MNHDPRRILLFGGTFDPPHHAHVALSSFVAETLTCGRIVFIPAARNPLREEEPVSSPEHRLAMLRLAIRDVERAEISTIEIERGGPSYFVDTLRVYRGDEAADARLWFLIGADQALRFHDWRAWREILQLATPAVVLRPPWKGEAFAEALRDRYGDEEAARWEGWTVSAPILDVSGTEIRRRWRAGEPVEAFLDASVAKYVRTHGLYTDPAGTDPEAGVR